MQSGPVMAKKKSASKSSGRRKAAKRELVNTGIDKRFVRRGAKGRFKDSDDVSRSLSADRRRTAKKRTKSGYGDQGDRKRGGAKKK